MELAYKSYQYEITTANKGSFKLILGESLHKAADILARSKQREIIGSGWIDPALSLIITKSKDFRINKEALDKTKVLSYDLDNFFELLIRADRIGGILGSSYDNDSGLTFFVEDVFSGIADKMVHEYFKWFDVHPHAQWDFSIKPAEEMDAYNNSLIYIVF